MKLTNETIHSMDLIMILNRIFNPLPVPIILVDKDSKIIVINTVFADYLGFEKNQLLGRNVEEIDKNTRFPYVLDRKVSEIAWRHQFENGHTAIVHRIPVLDDSDEVLFGFGLVLFQDISEFKEIIQKNKQLDSELFHIKNEFKKIRGAKYTWDSIIGSSEKMLEAKYIGKKATLTASNVLIYGESGTGKELFAHAIHADSGRSYHSFIRVNCAAIPKDLIESILFGYEEGAYTGARKGGNIGKFELANNGTIFLDEIGELPLNMQAKLLRVLQEREIERIGGNDTIKIDVRVIAATNKDLRKMVEEKTFREDLYYRLNVMIINVPALRNRMDDLKVLVDWLIEKKCNEMSRIITGYSSDFMEYLESYNWPGNIRELENALERAINMSKNNTLIAGYLPVYLTKQLKNKEFGGSLKLKDAVADLEKRMIIEALHIANNNRSKATQMLGLSRSSFYEKIKKYDIE
ncbi:sigma 54-interacting transcriptional regulator [Clostridiaceae bacterium HSG29]|nr:sigma 54-interacting transcriptional regulator [Clostridiaceae bacterium HSG29]